MAIVLELERGRQKNQEFKIIPGYNFPDGRGCRRACLKTSQPEARRAKQTRVLTHAHPHTLSGRSSTTGRVTHLSAPHTTQICRATLGADYFIHSFDYHISFKYRKTVVESKVGIPSLSVAIPTTLSLILSLSRGYGRVCTVSKKPEKVFASVLFLLNSLGAPPFSKRTRRVASQLLCPVSVLLGPALWHRLTLSRLTVLGPLHLLSPHCLVPG